MKDLKHLIFFENLLQDAQNELVTQAVNDGKIALGYNCYYIPEVLLNLPGCFSSRLRAPRCESTDVATYYMTSRVCPYVRSILERAIEGGYNYLNALFGAECCASMERMEEHFFLINPVKNDRFFVTQIDPPLKGDKTSYDYYKGQLKLKVVDQLAERYGVDTSDAAMRATIEKFNELCDVITEIGNFRKLPNPPITGYEFHVIQPDLSHAGGLTEVKKIASTAEAYDVALAPHCPLGPIALASCLNVDATCYNAVIQEQSIGIHYNVGKSVLDYVKNQDDFKFVDGRVQLPVRPGLGVDVNKELVLEENKTPHEWKNPVWRHKDGSVAEW